MLKGKDLEKKAEMVNASARRDESALILKIPTPIILTNKGLIPQSSTVDFAGVIKGGRFIAFDAKETHSETSFPLSNIKQHQFNYLDMVDRLGGIAFFLIHFVVVHPLSAFAAPISLFKDYYTNKKRKSIPLVDFDLRWLVNIDSYLTEVTKLYELK